MSLLGIEGSQNEFHLQIAYASVDQVALLD